MVPFERALVVSYGFSIVTIALSLTIRPQFAVEYLRRSNQQGWVTLGQNLWEENAIATRGKGNTRHFPSRGAVSGGLAKYAVGLSNRSTGADAKTNSWRVADVTVRTCCVLIVQSHRHNWMIVQSHYSNQNACILQIPDDSDCRCKCQVVRKLLKSRQTSFCIFFIFLFCTPFIGLRFVMPLKII